MPSGPPTRTLRRRKRQKGRPKKVRRSGRPRTLRRPTSTPSTPMVVSPVRVPFLPRIRGRKSPFSRIVSPGCILVSNTRHNLRDDLPHMPRNSTCKVCYVQKRVRRTIYACDKCNTMMCPHCFPQLDSHRSLSCVRAILRIP